MKQRICIDNGVTLVVDRSAAGKVLLSIEHPVFTAPGPFTLDADAACAVSLALSLSARQIINASAARMPNAETREAMREAEAIADGRQGKDHEWEAPCTR